MTLTDLICWVDRFAATKAVIINVVGGAEHVFSLPVLSVKVSPILRPSSTHAVNKEGKTI